MFTGLKRTRCNCKLLFRNKKSLFVAPALFPKRFLYTNPRKQFYASTIIPLFKFEISFFGFANLSHKRGPNLYLCCIRSIFVLTINHLYFSSQFVYLCTTNLCTPICKGGYRSQTSSIESSVIRLRIFVLFLF